MRIVGVFAWVLSVGAVSAASGDMCTVVRPTASFSIPHLKIEGSPSLNTDLKSRLWSHASRAFIVKDCSRDLDYPELRTEVRGFWTDDDLWLLFSAPYKTLNVFTPPLGGGPRDKLWDRDVVEMFLGDDWKNIRHYREFEISPTGDWIDLAIDLDHEKYDQTWRSGWKTAARIDEKSRTWFAAVRIPLRAVSNQKVEVGTRWRANLYRIEGLGEDPQRHFLCWQPTCVKDRDPNHVPENFGTLVFAN